MHHLLVTNRQTEVITQQKKTVKHLAAKEPDQELVETKNRAERRVKILQVASKSEFTAKDYINYVYNSVCAAPKWK